jgi:hypothetical protein
VSKPPAGPAPGFAYRRNPGKPPYAVRTFIDFPVVEGEAVAAAVTAIAAEESENMGEPVSAQTILRRAIRAGLAATGDEEGLLNTYRALTEERKTALEELVEALFHLPEGASGAHIVTLQPPVRSITVHPCEHLNHLPGHHPDQPTVCRDCGEEL